MYYFHFTKFIIQIIGYLTLNVKSFRKLTQSKLHSILLGTKFDIIKFLRISFILWDMNVHTKRDKETLFLKLKDLISFHFSYINILQYVANGPTAGIIKLVLPLSLICWLDNVDIMISWKSIRLIYNGKLWIMKTCYLNMIFLKLRHNSFGLQLAKWKLY